MSWLSGADIRSRGHLRIGVDVLGEDEMIAANRGYWEAVVESHFDSDFYEVDKWLSTGLSMREREEDLLGDLTDKDVVHLQCHFGKDSLSIAAAGARVIGIDYSQTAIEKARELARRVGLFERCSFEICSVEEVAVTFVKDLADLVYVSLGAICWIAKIDSWAKAVDHLLRQGGVLFMHEVHPLAQMVERVDGNWSLSGDYFEKDSPMIDESEGSYVDGSDDLGTFKTYIWNHSIGEIVTALTSRGFVITHLEEHSWTSFLNAEGMTKSTNEHFVQPDGWVQLPLSFTLMATKR